MKKIILTSLIVTVILIAGSEWAQGPPPGKQPVEDYPIWQIFKDETAKSVEWIEHEPNPRFAIYDANTPADPTDDLVLDKETGLIWARNANLLANEVSTWEGALDYCRGFTMGNRMGWRLPTVEELSSLVDPSRTGPALPTGHPFIGVQAHYWSSSTHGANSFCAWIVHLDRVYLDYVDKPTTAYVLPVRGGNGYATGNW